MYPLSKLEGILKQRSVHFQVNYPVYTDVVKEIIEVCESAYVVSIAGSLGLLIFTDL